MFGNSRELGFGEVDRQRVPRRPIGAGRLRLDQPNCGDAVGLRQFRFISRNYVGSRRVQKPMTCNLLLFGEPQELSLLGLVRLKCANYVRNDPSTGSDA
jgi:hypothetical protein